MPDICLYLQVHQPYRVAAYRVFDIGTDADYFDRARNRAVLERVAARSYDPTNAILARTIRASGGAVRLALGLTGVLLEQLEAFCPRTLASFQALVDTGGVELLGETYYHSLAALGDAGELVEQVERHGDALRRLFGVTPRAFRGTELLYEDAMAARIAELGHRAVLVEGTPHALGARTPNAVYAAAGVPDLRLLPRNRRLSDDIAFRFSDRGWADWPLRVDRYAEWLAASPGEYVGLFLDYETFGEHHPAASGIFDFLGALPEACAARGLRFVHPSALAGRAPRGILSCATITSWADTEHDASAWLGNRMQRAAHERLYRLRPLVAAAGDPELMERWRRLTTSDHFYYMSTKRFDDGDVHAYFSPFATPYDAFVAYMNVLQDLEQRTGSTRPPIVPRDEVRGCAGSSVAV